MLKGSALSWSWIVRFRPAVYNSWTRRHCAQNLPSQAAERRIRRHQVCSTSSRPSRTCIRRCPARVSTLYAKFRSAVLLMGALVGSQPLKVPPTDTSCAPGAKHKISTDLRLLRGLFFFIGAREPILGYFSSWLSSFPSRSSRASRFVPPSLRLLSTRCFRLSCQHTLAAHLPSGAVSRCRS